jgi:hypothetical protein
MIYRTLLSRSLFTSTESFPEQNITPGHQHQVGATSTRTQAQKWMLSRSQATKQQVVSIIVFLVRKRRCLLAKPCERTHTTAVRNSRARPSRSRRPGTAQKPLGKANARAHGFRARTTHVPAHAMPSFIIPSPGAVRCGASPSPIQGTTHTSHSLCHSLATRSGPSHAAGARLLVVAPASGRARLV